MVGGGAVQGRREGSEDGGWSRRLLRLREVERVQSAGECGEGIGGRGRRGGDEEEDEDEQATPVPKRKAGRKQAYVMFV